MSTGKPVKTDDDETKMRKTELKYTRASETYASVQYRDVTITVRGRLFTVHCQNTRSLYQSSLYQVRTVELFLIGNHQMPYRALGGVEGC